MTTLTTSALNGVDMEYIYSELKHTMNLHESDMIALANRLVKGEELLTEDVLLSLHEDEDNLNIALDSQEIGQIILDEIGHCYTKIAFRKGDSSVFNEAENEIGDMLACFYLINEYGDGISEALEDLTDGDIDPYYDRHREISFAFARVGWCRYLEVNHTEIKLTLSVGDHEVEADIAYNPIAQEIKAAIWEVYAETF